MSSESWSSPSRVSAKVTIVTGTRKLPTRIKVGTRIVSSVTAVITAPTIHTTAPPISSSSQPRWCTRAGPQQSETSAPGPTTHC